MDREQRLVDMAIKIGKYNSLNLDNQLVENYRTSDFYQALEDDEKKICDVILGDDDDLTKIIITRDQVSNYLKGFISYNGFYQADLDEDQLDQFLKEVISDERTIYKKIVLELGIRYANLGLEFNGYNEELLASYQTSTKLRFNRLSLLYLGDGLYIGFPLMAATYISNDYQMTNIMSKVLGAEYVLDSDVFFEFFKIYSDYRISHISEKTLKGNLENIHIMKDSVHLSQDEIYKYRFEKSMNPKFKLHLRIYEVTNEFASADKEEARFISEGYINYNPTIKMIYDLYEEISEYYRPFMTDADYLVLDWMRYKIAMEKNNNSLAEQLGLNILKYRRALKGLPKTFYIYTNYVLPLQYDECEILRDFSKYYSDEILFNLLDYYVKSFRYDEAYNILKEWDRHFRLYLSDDVDERIKRYNLENLERNVQWDIGLIIGDLQCSYNESIERSWFEKLEATIDEFKASKLDRYEYRKYKRMSQYISNVIVVMITIEDYEAAKRLLSIYNKYLIKDEDYLALEKFVRRESELRANIDILNDMLGLFSLETKGMHKFLNKFHELTSAEMNKKITLSESENKVLEVLSKASNYDYEQCFQLIKNAQKKYISRMTEADYDYDFFSAYFDDAINHLVASTKEDPSYEEVEANLCIYFDDTWLKFTDETRSYLITANVLNNYLINREDSNKFDYSPICLCWAKAVEGEFQKKFYTPIINAYNNSLKSAGRKRYPQSSFFISRNMKRNSKEVDTKNFTLGSLVFISGIYADGNYRNEGDWNRFSQFLKENVYTTMNMDQIKSNIMDITRKSQKLNRDYRIKAAHPLEAISKKELNQCKDIVFQSQELLKLIAKDMDKEWPMKSLIFK